MRIWSRRVRTGLEVLIKTKLLRVWGCSQLCGVTQFDEEAV
jgi:hypothetical protein